MLIRNSRPRVGSRSPRPLSHAGRGLLALLLFGQNAIVANGFSDLIAELWCEPGGHASSAPGQGPSQLYVPIIFDAIVAIN